MSLNYPVKWECTTHKCPIEGEPRWIQNENGYWELDQSEQFCVVASNLINTNEDPDHVVDRMLESCRWEEENEYT